VSLRILVCGGRAYGDAHKLGMVLDVIHIMEGVACIIHGDAPGADRMADNWAWLRKVPAHPYPILRPWEDGYHRNTRMLSAEEIDMVVAFPGGSGTADMVRKARRAGIPVKEIA
jgi:YspA, cpYpsA-related SLOG family